MSEEKTSYFSFGLRLFKRDADFLIEKNSVESSFRNYLSSKGINLDNDTKEDKEKELAQLEIEFESEIKKAVYRFINKNFDNIVFFAGAGASVVLEKSDNTEKNKDAKSGIDSNYGKTVAMLAENINTKLNEESDSKDIYSLKDLAKKAHYAGVITEKNQRSISDHFDLEDFLSCVIHFEPYINNKKKKEKYIATKKRVLEIIKENTSYSYDGKKFKHEGILNILTERIEAPSKLSVITTNYDTVFEDAAANQNYTVFDGFKFLAKPKFDSDMFNWNLVKEVSDIKTRELEYNKRVFNLIKLHGSLTWKRDEEGEIVRVLNGEKVEADDTVMIFPSSDKYAQSYQEPYFDLFTKFQELLKRKNTLLITAGFSFSDNHIFRMISQAVKNNKELALLVTDYDIDQPNNKNWQELLNLSKDYHQVAFLKATMNDNLGTYLGARNDN
ncbi:SIR2 family protein [Lactobacillus apis]|uniref:SIR2 family protein n=1 Tax=Lactobacillus apis TaxID=303541 RepID=UPI00242DC9A4|nr:SIR2 family protein [Lactobacillus apis]